MIDAHKVVFNGLDNFEFDITPHLSFDGSNGGESSFLNRDSIYSEHYDGSFRRIHSYKYNEVLSPTFTFLKENFSDFDESENRRVLSWLTGSSKPGWIEIYKDDSNVISYRLFGNFIDVEVYKLGNSRVVGYVATFESSAPYAFSRPMSWPQNLDNLPQYEYQLVNSSKENTQFKIECETDEYSKVLYPKVTIKYKSDSIYLPVNGQTDPTADDTYDMIPNVIYSYKETLRININGERHVVTPLTIEGAELNPEGYKSSGYCYSPTHKDIRKAVEGETQGTWVWESVGKVYAAVQIENKYKLNGEDKSTTTWIAGGVDGETIVLDGENKIVYNKTQNDKDVVMIIGDRFNFNWFPLAYGTNNITIIGDCEIKFEWVEPRKVGSL
jgi:hypothetical protein